jgi:putative DNA-invertase from lambdoid prophage Rac
MTAIGYVRISNEKKQDPASQIELMLNEGIDIKNVFVDIGSGATIPNTREAYLRMSERLKVGDVTELVFSEYSRIGRDVVESLGAVLDIMRSFRGVKLRSLSATEKDINEYPIDIQFVLMMFGMSAAKRERDHIKERTKWGMDNAKANGTRSGKPIGRPVVTFDYDAVKKLMVDAKLKEAQAIRVLGYSPSTYYKSKKMGGIIEQT